MTVGTLKKILEQYPEHMQVFVDERKSDFRYAPVESVRCEEIKFTESPDDKKALAKEKVLILDEEL